MDQLLLLWVCVSDFSQYYSYRTVMYAQQTWKWEHGECECCSEVSANKSERVLGVKQHWLVSLLETPPSRALLRPSSIWAKYLRDQSNLNKGGGWKNGGTVTKTWEDLNVLTSIAGFILGGQAWLMDWWSKVGSDWSRIWINYGAHQHYSFIFCVLGQNVKHKLRNFLVQNTRSFPQSLKQRTS